MALLAALAFPAAAQTDQDSPKTLDTLRVQTQRAASYTPGQTSTGTRLSLSALETTQSVSVVGREQMDDFALTSANAVLDQAAGVNVERIETDRTYYSARGFDVTNFQVDGLGLPFTNGGTEGDIDTAIYERIDVLRGANGLLSSTGNPSATVNFVRKRPTEDFQGSVGLSAGSWENYRVDADLSGKLNHSGSVRGRVVGAWQQGNSYLDRYRQDKNLFYGVIEADLSDSTRLTVGASQQKNSPKGGMWGALPLYNTDGSATDYDRSTSSSADWSYWDTTDKRAFVELQQQLGGDWTLQAALNARKADSEGDLFYIYGTPDAQSGLGLYSYPSYYSSHETQRYADVYATGSFALGGRSHQAVVGINLGKTEVDQLSWYSSDIGTALPRLEDWTGDYTKPSFDAYSLGADFEMTRKSAYATVRWNLTDRLKLITGLNHTQIESNGLSYGEQHVYDESKTTPFVGAVYNFDPNYALYGSYAEIFNPQTQLDANLQSLDPITGSTGELGIKGQWLDSRVTAAFSLFRAKQNNTAESAGYVGTTAIYTGIDATSTGYEGELSGQLNDHWQISTSLTQLSIKGQDGQNVRTYVPRRVVKLATTYRIPGMEQLKIGASFRWHDQIVRDQGALDTSGQEIFTRQGAYALVGLMAHYDISSQFSATLNANNITDKKYINSLYWAQGFYGAGRNGTLSLNYRF